MTALSRVNAHWTTSDYHVSRRGIPAVSVKWDGEGSEVNATSADVARHAGVSRATVSQVLNGYADRFAPETAAKVYASAEELGYEPSAAGRTLRRGSSDFVVALLPHTTFGGHLQDLFEQMSVALADHGYTLVLRIAGAATATLDRLVAGMKPAAVWSFAPFTDDERAVLDRRGVLAIDPPSVTQVDHNRAIGQLQARTLIEHGYRRLAFAHLQDERHDPFGFAREDGVREVARQHGLDEIDVTNVALDLDSAVRALDGLSAPGVAVAAYNDDVAMALLSAARLRELEVPRDLAVIGMDRTDLSRIAVPRLTTIEYDIVAASEAGTASLLQALGAGAPQPAAAPAVLHLIEGETI
ncbi:substrate-binding domain-containing protein [Microbacterium invictum]|uniref:DNA-binding LacI/PurR family transcriptional regulator n=1 Tax=Microbacterium invictum TaxID=515415 RepID=A0AA40SS57_9MICO|nr:LacI family DNA-binding transcriptional regulator [Microbacterium invictum]MBB4141237.1 DNA-binding LacI/PurR family transcriptional regulator [Microbacterium invictum]